MQNSELLAYMAAYRTHMKIIEDILTTADDSLRYDDGATVTYLIRNANISHVRIIKILKILVTQGLLEQVDSKRARKYRISTTGRQFLQEYRTFAKFSENFGLVI